MKLNTLKPAFGSKTNRRRVGRGCGSGLGKTAGRGHKGQHSRSGGYHKVGFEGGQQPLQRRLPKVGFNSRIGLVTVEVPLSALNKVAGNEVTFASLIESNLISAKYTRAKVMLSGEINKAITLKGISVTKGAKAAIEAAGGSVEE
ncbi:50S ribosomal protein L15 [Ignatzschineria ureiclastica]|uniref:Large ribosomal subunit protein uL15 n=2 Tax=Ignatzschineria TaxID=112008 RepID=A0A2U2AH13_9GAMM|nr:MULTISPECIES: 50S ribosomal protein L15 [Ignatzschineria]PWD81945.1 50S ribosomal protein L15 [Ignatzschineria ureiclastica]GGZ91585.1 50S ribosomal protein L15 [Ignatzschineria ureiclastica]